MLKDIKVANIYILLFYKSGYKVGKYVSLEKQIENTKDVYYSILQDIDVGWHEEKNDPTPFIRYTRELLLACYTEFEDRVGMMDTSGAKSSAYDIVKSYIDKKIGKFTSSDVLTNCPSISRASVFNALKKLTEESYVDKYGVGKKAYYVKREKMD